MRIRNGWPGMVGFVPIAFTLAIAHLSATSAAEGRSPTALTRAFYAWRLGSESARSASRFAGTRPFLTQHLFAELSQVEAIEKRDHRAILDFDPFTDAQIAATSVDVVSAAVRPQSANVIVIVRFRGASHRMRVSFQKSGLVWRISDFVGRGGGLEALLRNDLREVRAAPRL